MSGEYDSPLLTPAEGPAARVLNANGSSPVVLVCEHASKFIPETLGGLGMVEADEKNVVNAPFQ